MTVRPCISALVLAAAFPVIALSAPSPTEADPVPAVGNDVENFIVTGQRPIRDFMLDFIAEIGDPVSDNRGFARFRKRVCVSVQNLGDLQAAQYVVDQVSTVAQELGLTPGEPGCSPNVHIVFSTDGAALAGSLVESHPRLFRPFHGTGGTTQGVSALEQFKTSTAPVRWWQVTMVVNREGGVAIELPGSMGNGIVGSGPTAVGSGSMTDTAPSAERPTGLDGVPWITGSNSRIVNSASDELWATYVIVDATKLGDVDWSQLSDYLAMVSLAQIAPTSAPAGYDSILNLFNTDSPASGMTDLDLSYLLSLYDMDTFRMPNHQRGMLATTMVRGQDNTAEDE